MQKIDIIKKKKTIQWQKQKKVWKKLKKSMCEYEMKKKDFEVKCLTKFTFCMYIGVTHQALNALAAI